eukprot:gb/GFBE01070848.1/.p2 GENE.gb/GFBE01070848.1/~~gb/GFBE01070848.1/.p2  ORF type:complete len:281 (-),score=111.08 gb/GFBE01070848.1/:91-933(-)
MRTAVALLTLCAAVVQARKKAISAAEEALQALDLDHSGKVERNELQAFAQSKGLTLEQVNEEFKSIDLNGNGELEASEIRQALSPDDEDARPAAPLQQQQQALQQQPLLQQQQPLQQQPLQVQQQPALIEQEEVAPAPVAQPAALTAIATEELEGESEKHAGHAVAELFEQRAAKALQAMKKDADQAEILEQTARSLRGQAEQLQRDVPQQAAAAAKEATDRVLVTAKEQVKLMDSEVTSAEEQADESRKLSQQAMQQAMAAQAQITATVQRIKAQRTSA